MAFATYKPTDCCRGGETGAAINYFMQCGNNSTLKQLHIRGPPTQVFSLVCLIRALLVAVWAGTDCG